ncbi:MAG: PhzF family phenazine biosynthesis protein [Candidatus Nanopelagicales bacterium]|nr:PhzF family phenazine biosynthesis protein [Candidatus Nanopelagicales bacterium]
MRLRFVTCDVFTDTRFGGNPLAVLPDARGLTGAQMQQVAREFNYSESTFVLPAERGGDRRVRIFTPTREVPFAGHPNVGTAFVLARLGELGAFPEPRTVVFEEDAGDVPVEVTPVGEGLFSCQLRAPEAVRLGPELPVDLAAAALGIDPADVVTRTHGPRVASVGLPFIVVEVVGLVALGRARADLTALERLAAAAGGTADIHVYVRTPAAADAASQPVPGLAPPDLRTRMFAPFDGVPEDPATGSANAALAGLLASLDPGPRGTFAWRIAQGVEMGRPSVLSVRAEKADGIVTGVWVAGEAVQVSEGWIEV